MGDELRHKCGVALIRLLKPLQYYQEKYGTWQYGLRKLYLLMEKQRNRGQDGAGIVTLKFDTPPGHKYFYRHRSTNPNAINEIFEKITDTITETEQKNHGNSDAEWAKANLPFAAELYMGHLRYGTFGGNTIDTVHPVMRENNWKSRNLVIAGNFNLTNVDELFDILVELGQAPKDSSDTVTILEKIGHFLDRENQSLFDKFKAQGYTNIQISELIARNMDLAKVLYGASKRWDGGFAITGMIGNGDAFFYRDPWGIRPAFHYHDEEIGVFASERAVIQTVVNAPYEEISEVPPGHAVIIRKNGNYSVQQVTKKFERKSCSFERIYFSRGSDQDIYNERKHLGELLVPRILRAVDYDLKNTVFSYIPNTAESAFFGLIKGIQSYLADRNKEILKKNVSNLTDEELEQLISERPRIEKVAIKDVKLRTFITQDKGRKDLVGHVYDITYGTVRRGLDNLVVIDDSIVRGTTLKESILRILDRLGPKKIIVVSSSPQLRYPDCYGIDMAKLGDFIAFKAAIALLKEYNKENIITDVYEKCISQKELPKEEYVNYVKEIYAPFTYDEISLKITQLLRAEDLNAEIEIVYQTIEDLHRACPNDTGDWYFTGDYPTPGGNKVVSTSFINYYEGLDKRPY